MSTTRKTLTAKDIMTVEPVCVGPATTIRELARMFEENEISGAPVVDAMGAVVGVVSKTDLIRACSEGTADVPPAYLFEILSAHGGDGAGSEVVPEPLICVQDFMTADPVTVAAHTPAIAVARLMVERRIHRVIVVDTGKFPVGLITSLDLVDALSSADGDTPPPTVAKRRA